MATKKVNEQLATWNDKFIQCRDWGHNWKYLHTVDLSKTVGGVDREFECRNCKTTKSQWLSRRTGEVFSNRYKYPKGYLKSPGVTDTISRQEIRVEALQRLLEGRK